jgi:hypothetical protein
MDVDRQALDGDGAANPESVRREATTATKIRERVLARRSFVAESIRGWPDLVNVLQWIYTAQPPECHGSALSSDSGTLTMRIRPS